MAREIHDTLLQSLVGVLLRLDEVASTLDQSAAEARDKLRRLTQQVEFYIREARESIRDLRSPALQNRDLSAALHEAADRIIASSGASLAFEVGGPARRASRKVEENLLRIGQEAIANAVRHGAPSTVLVQLHYHERSVLLRVADDGSGFDTAAIDCGREGHWGIVTMRERSEQIGGTFVLTSSPRRGTRIEISAPI